MQVPNNSPLAIKNSEILEINYQKIYSPCSLGNCIISGTSFQQERVPANRANSQLVMSVITYSYLTESLETGCLQPSLRLGFACVFFR